jgi:predicted ATPase
MLATTARPDLRRHPPGADLIHTPDQRLRVFVSSTLQEMAAERQAVRDAVTRLRLVPVMFELGARPHPPRQVYRSYLAQSQVFVGVYGQSYGWVAPGEERSGLEDEYQLSAGMPRLIYVKSPAPDRAPRLEHMLARIRDDGSVSYQGFSGAAELQRLVEDDLAVLLSERFEMTRPCDDAAAVEPLAGALPVPATPLVDREQETAAATDLIERQGARLITFTGPGGVGKSRLALQAAGRLGSRFADGIRFVDLASVRSADLVAAVIATRLGLSTSGGRLMADVTSYLRHRQVLLLLDNFEHVAGAAPLVAELLAAAPGLVIMVTSRAVLRLRGERELPVPPLAVPPAGAGRRAESLQQYPSVRLFCERARATAPDFKLTSGNAPAVAEICRRLDGLPLAIELAAARIRVLPPRALLARLDDRLSVLTEGPRDLPERQRTLRNTLDWSYGLLSPAEQALFARLGVFAGTFGLPAAEAVCGTAVRGTAAEARSQVTGQQETRGTLETLGALVDSSLVRPQARGDEPRFSLLETIREYALERLRDRGDWAEVHERHASYFLTLAEPASSELQGAGQLAWLDRLEIRYDNLRAALSWLADTGQLAPAIRLIWATWRFWWLRGHADELARYTEKILAGSDRLSPYQRAQALAQAGFTVFADGNRARAQSLFEQSLPLYRQAGDTLGAAPVAAALGHLLAARHRDARASILLEDTLARLRKAVGGQLARRQRHLYLLDLTLANNFLGQIRLRQADHDGAAALFADGLAAARSAPDRFTILVSLYDLALSRQARGDLPGAAGLLREGLSLATEAGDQPSAAYYLEALADVASRQDEPERAVGLLSAAAALLQARGSGWLHAYVPRAPHDGGTKAALRSRVGDAAFEQAWACGRALDGTRAVQHALGQAQPGLAPR